uniref:Spaetzle domain-containing protein n=1 Tax=Panagrolaimus sp. JU765 TaxID=591449 RepID=A0AC34Q605_9BILA
MGQFRYHKSVTVRIERIPKVTSLQQNRSLEECRKLTQAELVTELKQKGTYNPDLMAWDVTGIFRFLDRSIVDQYEKQSQSKKNSEQAVERNAEALERLFSELGLHCNVRSPAVLSKLHNLTTAEPRRTIMSPSIRMTEEEIRTKRQAGTAEWIKSFNNSRLQDEFIGKKKQKLIGNVHVVPFGCDKRGEQEDGYLRLCSACQAIRKLPDTFFPPFINEVMCDEDKACLYFYDYPHGKCKQKHMNFVVLKNVGTQKCQIWQKFNLNVRVSCECFVDEMSFFAKYV